MRQVPGGAVPSRRTTSGFSIHGPPLLSGNPHYGKGIIADCDGLCCVGESMVLQVS